MRYADGSTIIAETVQDLQTLLDRLVDASQERGLTLNVNKTTFLTIAKTQQQDNLNIKEVP